MTEITQTDLTFMSCGLLPECAVDWDDWFDEFYALQYMSSGGIALSYDQRSYLLEGQWFWLGYPGPRTHFLPARGYATWTHRYVTFRGPLISQWKARGLLWDAPQAAPLGSDYAAKFDDLLGLAQRTDRWGIARATNRCSVK